MQKEIRMNKKMLPLLAVLLLIASIVGAGGQGDSGGAGVVVEEWEIPFLNCLTGAIASIGEYLQWGAERAAYEINQAGGIAGKPVKVIGVDTALEPQKGVVEMSKIVEWALVALGPVPEPVIMAAAPIAVENEMMTMTATTSLEYAEQFFPWSISWFPSTADRLPPLAREWAKDYGVKNVVQFVGIYGPWPGMAAAHVDGIEEAGAQHLGDVEVPQDAVTFGPLVVKALGMNPDGIIIACWPDKAAKIVQELKSRGWTDMEKILLFSSADDAALYTTGGADLNGAIIYNYINVDVTTPRWVAFKEAYQKDHNGLQPPSLSTNYYDAVYMIKRAIEETGVTGDPKKLKEERKLVAEAMLNMKNFEGLLFNWDMSDGVPTNKPGYLFQIQDGRKKLVKEIRN
jgi:branched-chain amino acid transport system substrate-binding protein